MLLKPTTEEEFTKQVAALPEHQRRVVVLAGRHLNEGSRNIAVRHHKEWEAHGAVTVLIPAAWTPHGFWKEMRRETGNANDSPNKAKEKAKSVPNDHTLINALEQAGMRQPVINLHGTSRTRISLDLVLNRSAHPSVQRAAKRAAERDPLRIRVRTKQMGIRELAKTEVLVEFNFAGKPRKKTGNVESGIKQTQLDQSYLTEPNITRGGLEEWKKTYAPQFASLVKELAAISEIWSRR